MSSSTRFPSIGANDSLAILKRSIISETKDMIMVKRGRAGEKISGRAVARWR